MEFRLHIRKLLEAAETKDIDALFDTLDADKGGTLDVPEIQQALKKLQTSAAKAKALEEKMRADLVHFAARVEAAKTAAAATLRMERTQRDLAMVKSGKLPLRDRLGAKLADKATKSTVNEIVSQWGAAGDGEVCAPLHPTSTSYLYPTSSLSPLASFSD